MPAPSTNSSDKAARKDASLRFSSTASSKRKLKNGEEVDEATGSFNDLVKRTKTNTIVTEKSKNTPREPKLAKDADDGEMPIKSTRLNKDEKAALKAKRKAAKKMLSFED